MQRDQHRLMREAEKLARKADECARERLEARIKASATLRARRLADIPTPDFKQGLPVNERRHEIAAAISAHQVVIVCGETGSGKTTQLPQICLELKRGVAGLIGHTQPRRIAARSVAGRIAQELGSELGQAVGYQVRFHDRVGENSYIKVMTDGILLAETQGDRFLDAYDTIIIDEAHERSLNIDFLLGYLKQILPRRPDLKIIITSATIDADRFSRHFDNAPVIEVSGRMFPVEIRYRPSRHEEGEAEDQTKSIVQAVDEIAGHGGDILIFLPGEREIREVAEALRKHHPAGAEILPLFSRLSNAEQDRVFKPGGGRRIVLATNVAETSLTVPGIRFVIDPGYARIHRYSVRAKVERLQIEKISRASASQRSGRCGRVASGICIRLYSEDDFNARSAYTDPEIRRSNLAAVILRMQALGLGEVEDFPFLDAPDPRSISDGFNLLEELGAVSDTRKLTPLGQQLAKLPIDPRIARMILAARQENCLTEVLIIAAALSVQDPRERPLSAQDAADVAHRRFQDERSDFLGFIKLWNFYEEALIHKKSSRKLAQTCHEHFLSALRMREWREVHGQLAIMVKEMGIRPNEVGAEYAQIHRALLVGLLGNIGIKGDNREYQGARGIRFSIFPGSVLFKPQKPATPPPAPGANSGSETVATRALGGPKWLMAAELTETTRLYGRTLARIEPEWIEPLAGHLIKHHYFEPHWEKKTARVAAFENVSLYGLIIEARRKIHFGPINPKLAREIFIRSALVEGEYLTRAPFFAHNHKLVDDIEALEHKARRQDILVDEQRIFEFYDQRIPEGIHNGQDFDKWQREAERASPRLLFMTREQLMRHEADHVTEALFPATLKLGENEYQLAYRFEHGHALDGVTLILPLAALNQISANRCDWLVPGLLREKLTWLIRALPQSLRSACVPVPDCVTSAMSALPPSDTPPEEALSRFLLQSRHLSIPRAAWRLDELPMHLRMNFSIVNEQGGEMACDRNLHGLKQEFGAEARQNFGAAIQSEFERSNITCWNFGELPEKVEINRNGQRIQAYPALAELGQGVGLQVFDTPEAAELAMRAGLARLLLQQMPEQARYLEKSLPVSKAMCLHYLPLGHCDALKSALRQATINHVLTQDKFPVRNAADFTKRLNTVKPLLVTAVNDLCKLVGEILHEHHGLLGKIEKLRLPATALADIRQQIDDLICADFLVNTPLNWLKQFPRYLKAIQIRLDKLPGAVERDTVLMREIAPSCRRWKESYTQLLKREEIPDQELLNYRWLTEELRVSLFAQELKTIQPVSEKRLEKQWDLLSNIF